MSGRGPTSPPVVAVSITAPIAAGNARLIPLPTDAHARPSIIGFFCVVAIRLNMRSIPGVLHPLAVDSDVGVEPEASDEVTDAAAADDAAADDAVVFSAEDAAVLDVLSKRLITKAFLVLFLLSLYVRCVACLSRRQHSQPGSRRLSHSSPTLR